MELDSGGAMWRCDEAPQTALSDACGATDVALTQQHGHSEGNTSLNIDIYTHLIREKNHKLQTMITHILAWKFHGPSITEIYLIFIDSCEGGVTEDYIC